MTSRFRLNHLGLSTTTFLFPFFLRGILKLFEGEKGEFSFSDFKLVKSQSQTASSRLIN